jgi:hypothetical protein
MDGLIRLLIEFFYLLREQAALLIIMSCGMRTSLRLMSCRLSQTTCATRNNLLLNRSHTFCAFLNCFLLNIVSTVADMLGAPALCQLVSLTRKHQSFV